MLRASYETEMSDMDNQIFEILVPADHYLRQVKGVIDFEVMREKVADCYSADQGSPAIDPVRMIKFGFVQYQYSLSDREVLGRAQGDVSFRWFLDLSLSDELPVPSLLSQFRTRLGQERHQALFDEIVAQARAYGLVKDRLRLKDATQVIANVAIPTTLVLVAQVRERLLAAWEALAPDQVVGERQEVERMRQATVDLKDEERLLQRVSYVRGLVDRSATWLSAQSVAEADRARLEQALVIAHKLLADQDDPTAPDRLRSAVDPDVRCGKHGDFFDGYLLDVLRDADSEVLTAITQLPANGDEAANAPTLIEAEQAAHDNQVQALSLDSIGFNGPMLRTLTDPEGLDLTVYVPPHSQGITDSPYYTPDAFDRSEDGTQVTCPGGQTTDRRYRNVPDTGWVFYFRKSQCQGCEQLEQCMKKLPTAQGRTVSKNDYQAEYEAARQMAQTEAYQQVRQQHPKIERKLAELVRYHQARRSRYRGLARNRVQALMTGMTVNIKRIVRLVSPSPGPVRVSAAT